MTGVWHFGSPAHPYTVQALTRELTAVAATVPYHEPAWAAPEPQLSAKPAGEPVSAARDEWDFLKPMPRFGDQQMVTVPRETVPQRAAPTGARVVDGR